MEIVELNNTIQDLHSEEQLEIEKILSDLSQMTAPVREDIQEDYKTLIDLDFIFAKAKYAKAINDYLGIKDKAISKKLDIAKILSDICNHNGDVKDAFENGSIKDMDFNFDDIKKMVDESYENKEKTKTIELNKK